VREKITMRKNERGVTFIGWILLLLPVAIILYCVIRLTPVYVNYMAVVRSMTQLKTETPDGSAVNPTGVRNALEKRFDIEGINVPNVNDVLIQREGENWVAIAEYEEQVPLFFNINLLVQFHKQVTL
jgi:hypothetical protein